MRIVPTVMAGLVPAIDVSPCRGQQVVDGRAKPGMTVGGDPPGVLRPRSRLPGTLTREGNNNPAPRPRRARVAAAVRMLGAVGSISTPGSRRSLTREPPPVWTLTPLAVRSDGSA